MKRTDKNVLILSPFFYPEPISTGKFNTDIAIALRDKNYNISVLCSHPFYPKWRPLKTNQKIEGIKIIRGGSNIKYPSNTLLKRAILEVWFAFFILKRFMLLRNKVNVIIPVFPPSLAFFAIIPIIKYPNIDYTVKLVCLLYLQDLQ